jgi:hypothetical protein
VTMVARDAQNSSARHAELALSAALANLARAEDLRINLYLLRKRQLNFNCVLAIL